MADREQERTLLLRTQTQIDTNVANSSIRANRLLLLPTARVLATLSELEEKSLINNQGEVFDSFAWNKFCFVKYAIES